MRHAWNNGLKFYENIALFNAHQNNLACNVFCVLTGYVYGSQMDYRAHNKKQLKLNLRHC